MLGSIQNILGRQACYRVCYGKYKDTSWTISITVVGHSVKITQVVHYNFGNSCDSPRFITVCVLEGLEEKTIFGSLFPRTLLTAMEKNRFFSTAARSNLGVAWGRSYIFGDCVCKVKHNSPNPKDIGAAKM